MKNPLCKYKDIFGPPGSHPFRIFNTSMLDVGLTILAGILIAVFFRQNIWKVLIYLILFMIFCHRIFCVRSTTDKLLFP
jgi:hypothetical protein